uniref:Ig-like domain-containing protein n=1 Tax=Maylandia zebra TaxID=106582 RepID=A0A3P9BGB7_9CICH
MMNVIQALALSCWIAVSGSEFQTSEVQAGENVTLQCHRIYTYDVTTFWFRLVNGTTANSIAFKQASSSNVNYNAAFQPGKFEMTKNISALFLKIKQVDVSDSALYFCGYFSEGRLNLSVMQLKVGGKIIVKSLPPHSSSLDPATLKDPALQSAVQRRRRPAAETHVIYTTNRKN